MSKKGQQNLSGSIFKKFWNVSESAFFFFEKKDESFNENFDIGFKLTFSLQSFDKPS